MKQFIVDLLVLVLVSATSFDWGHSVADKSIQATCESDDKPTIINGTQYLCLSLRHLEMLRHQQRSDT